MVFIEYLYWHYMVAPGNILRILKNYLIGTWHQFLIKRHLATLFSPWHRVLPSQVAEEQTLGNKVLNGIIDFYIRIIAAIIRLTIILSGLIYELILIIGFLVFLILWIFWPIVFIILIIMGIALI